MYFKFTICFLLFATITGDLSSDWQKFKHDYNKQYASPAEEAERQHIFLENVEKMKEYQRTHPHAAFTIGINHLADRRHHELVTGSKSLFHLRSERTNKFIRTKSNIPASLDWRAKGVITDIYDQGQTTIVSSIVAVEVIESYHAIRTKQLVKGSINQVSKCCAEDITIFDCILTKLGGSICSANEYNASTAPCDRTACSSFAQFNKINKFEPSDENTMLTLIQDSPLYVGVDASQLSFQTYQQGVYQDKSCSKTMTDHVMQLVGYGVESNVPYWICKNSWGRNWGDRGYIRLERGRNTCGIANVVEQIEYVTGDAIRTVNFSGLYLTLFYVVVHLLSIL